jgi:hypothetical protein
MGLSPSEPTTLFFKSLGLNFDGLLDREVRINKGLRAEKRFLLGYYGPVSRV